MGGGGGGWGYLQNFQKNHLIGMGSHHLVLDAPRNRVMNGGISVDYIYTPLKSYKSEGNFIAIRNASPKVFESVWDQSN